jgi:predicted transcriptional regulator
MRLLHTGWSGTRIELAEKVHISERTLHLILPQLHRLGLCRIVRWEKRIGRGASMTAIYAFGDGKRHAKKPRKNVPGQFDAMYSVPAQRLISIMLAKGPSSVAEIAEAAGIKVGYASVLLSTLRRQGLVHVTEWRFSGRATPRLPYYVAGPGKCAEKPAALTASQLKKRRRAVLTSKYGREVATKIMNSDKTNTDRVVYEGRIVYERRRVATA